MVRGTPLLLLLLVWLCRLFPFYRKIARWPPTTTVERYYSDRLLPFRSTPTPHGLYNNHPRSRPPRPTRPGRHERRAHGRRRGEPRVGERLL